jgi:CheY-like chemotaxis protein
MVICTDESSNCTEQSSLVPIASNPDQMNVLIVDDSNLNRKLLCKLFRTLGHVVEEAEDGLLAIEKVKAKMSSSEANKACYDIILMDFVMPNMDGPTSTKIIRALGYSAPIFGLTGNALDSDVEYFLKNGADRVMAKPFNMLLFKQNLSQIKCNDAIPGSGKSTSMLDVKEKCEIQSIQSRRSFFL